MLQEDGSADVSAVASNLKRLRRQAKAAGTAFEPESLAAHFSNEFQGTQSVFHAYVRHCRDNGIPPEAFFLRKKVTNTLDLRHFSIGSKRAVALSLAISSLPLLQVRWHCYVIRAAAFKVFVLRSLLTRLHHVRDPVSLAKSGSSNAGVHHRLQMQFPSIMSVLYSICLCPSLHSPVYINARRCSIRCSLAFKRMSCFGCAAREPVGQSLKGC
jgi:hypothetical protein